MHIVLKRTGGIAGLTQETSVDTDTLPEQEAREFDELVRLANLAELTPRSPIVGGGADRFQYDLTVDREGTRHHVSVGEGAMPFQLRPLIGRLVDRGLQPRQK